MTTLQTIKENQQLKRSLEKLTELSTDLLKENSRRSGEIEKLMMQLVGINNRVMDILSSLVDEVRENDFLEIIPEDVNGNLDTVRLLVKLLLYNSEILERQNEVLRRKISEFKKGST